MEAPDKIGFVVITDSARTVPLTQVREALTRSGLSPETARDLAKRNSAIRAFRHMAENDEVLNRVSEDDSRIVYQLDSKFIAETRLTFAYSGQVWFDKNSEELGATTPELLALASTRFDAYCDQYMPSDVMRLTMRIFAEHRGILSMRESGGVYFVPSSLEWLAGKVQMFAKDVGMRLVITPTGGENGVREHVLENLVARVRGEIESMQAEIGQKSDDDVTPRIAANRLESLVGQINRIKTFAKSLGASVDQIERLASTAEVDLGIIQACDTVDVLVAMAGRGEVTGFLGKLAARAAEHASVMPDVPMEILADASAGIKKAQVAAKSRLEIVEE
jgi:hypothetical protein